MRLLDSGELGAWSTSLLEVLVLGGIVWVGGGSDFDAAHDGRSSRQAQLKPDGDNKQIAIGLLGSGTPTATFVYNADGLIVQQVANCVTTNYTVDPTSGFGDVVEERDQNGALPARCDYGASLLDMQRATGVTWYLFAVHGSTVQLVNNAEGVTDTFGYGAFGNLLSRTRTTPNVCLYDE
jgi:hypothetical protein